MPRHQTIPSESRQNIRIEIAERLGISIEEVPYPTSNITYYQYSLELDYITPEYYNRIIEIEMLRQRTRDQARNTRRTYNNINRRNLSHQRLFGIMLEAYNSISQEVQLLDNYERELNDIIIRGFRLMGQRIDEAVGIVREHPMDGVENINPPQSPVTHERLMDRHGERLADTNNSLCRECLFPIELGESICEDCHMEIEIIPTWLMS